MRRKRHPGHLDGTASYDQVLAGLQALARLAPLEIGPRIEAGTSRDCDLDALVRSIHRAVGTPNPP
jgi:hypothetical protein